MIGSIGFVVFIELLVSSTHDIRIRIGFVVSQLSVHIPGNIVPCTPTLEFSPSGIINFKIENHRL